MLLGVVQQSGAAVQVPHAPGGDHLDVGLEGVVAQFEPDLIVALAGGAVGDRVGADFVGDLDLALGDQRPGDRGAEQVCALVQRVGAEHGEDEIADEFFAQVVDIDVARLDAQQFGLRTGGLQLLALADIGGEGHHLAAIGFLQPAQDDGSIEAAGIGQHDFFDVAAHVGARAVRELQCEGSQNRRDIRAIRDGPQGCRHRVAPG